MVTEPLEANSAFGGAASVQPKARARLLTAGSGLTRNVAPSSAGRLAAHGATSPSKSFVMSKAAVLIRPRWESVSISVAVNVASSVRVTVLG